MANLNVAEDECLELLLQFFHRQRLGCAEKSAAGVVDHNIECAGCRERLIKRAADGTSIGKIKCDRMKSLQLRNTIGIARSPPDFVPARNKDFGGCASDPRA